MNNPFLKYVMKDKKEDIFHSSAYGKMQNGGSIGVSSNETFAKRMEINQNRKVVRGYGDSRLANSGINNAPRPKTYAPPAGMSSSAAKMPPIRKNPGI